MNDIYIYNFDFYTKEKLSIIANKLNIKVHNVETAQYNLPIYQLLQDDKASSNNTLVFDKPMMLIHLPENKLDELLLTLKENQIYINLKAVITEYNLFYTSIDLYNALLQEDKTIHG